MSAPSDERPLRHTVARHGQLRTPKPLAQVMKYLSVAMATVLVAAAGVATFVATDLASTYTANAVDIGGDVPPGIEALQGGANILIAGTDVCEPEYAQYFGDRCGDGAEEGARSDVNLVVHISPEPRRITVVSFPRDLMVPIPECTDADGNLTSPRSKDMINSAFGTGGLACTAKTIEELSGMDIQYAASVNWGGVMQITDAVGGVTVCLAAGINDPHTGINWEAGERTIKGLEALQFLRTRYGVGSGGDLGRISNQQQYMSRLANKLMSSEVLSNPVTMLKLAKTGLGAVDPSTSLTDPMTIVQIALAVKSVPFDDIVFVSYPSYPDPWDPNRLVPDEEAATLLMTALQQNKAVVLTGTAGDGVVPEGEPVPEAGAPAATPAPAPTASGDAVTLPSQVTGTTAAQATCSAGNVR